MPSVYVSEETKEKLYRFINRSRVSPEFGAPKRLKTPNQAIGMLLDCALRYHYDDFERIAKMPSYVGEMSVAEFDNSEVRNKIILENLEAIENEESEDNRD